MTSLDTENKVAFEEQWKNIKTMLENAEADFDNLFTVYLYYTTATNPKTTLHKELLEQFKDKNLLKIIHDIKIFAEHYKKVLCAQDIYIYALKYLSPQIYWRSILTATKHIDYNDYDVLMKIIFAFYYQNWIAGGTASKIKQTSFNILKKVKEKSTLDDIKDESNQNFIPLNKKTHVEHILPQNREDTSNWNKIFTPEQKYKYTGCLGKFNYSFYEKKYSSQDHSFEDKKEIYKNTDNVSTSFELTRQIFDNNQWTETKIENRKKSLINKLKSDINIF